MAKDAEFDRLKATQDLVFQRKQGAYKAQQRAWEKRSSARDAMNRAFEAKQRAYDEQNSAWQRYQSIRSANGPRVDSLNAQQERAFQNMKSAFDSASSAHDRRDGAGAASYAADGHRYKAEAQGYVQERRRLVEEIRSARAPHDAAKATFQRTKDEFSAYKRTFDAAKAEHERASAEFKRAKDEFDSCAKAFRSRLEKVKATNQKQRDKSQKRRDDKKSIAAKAGVPHQHRDNVWVSTDRDGNANIYFGGVGEPNGPGHGHYVMDRNSKVTYKRDPFDPHGAQNFTDSQRQYEDVVGREAALSDEFGFRCKFRGYDAYVESNTNRQGCAKIDIYYGPNGPFGLGHHHAVAYRESPYDFVADNLR